MDRRPAFAGMTGSVVIDDAVYSLWVSVESSKMVKKLVSKLET